MKILITGATSGIGAQLVQDYLAEGCHVIACGRNKDKLAKLSDTKGGDNLTTLSFDVTDRDAVKRTLVDMADVDIAILNAGVCEYVDDAKHFDAALVERVFAANFYGVVYCAETLLPQLQQGAKLVIVDSMARLLPFTRSQAYGASKAAVHYFAKSLAVDVAKQGITVQTVSPGFVKTPMTDANDFEMPMRISVEDASKAMRKAIAKGKLTIFFPRVFGLIMRFLGKLPTNWQQGISSRMKTADKKG